MRFKNSAVPTSISIENDICNAIIPIIDISNCKFNT